MMYIEHHSRRSYLKSILLGALLGLIFVPIIYFLFLVPTEKPQFINEGVIDSILATCRIDAGTGSGSGVLLDTGYILTAAHVVDRNNNEVLELNERSVIIEFFDDFGIVSSVHNGRVVCISGDERIDFAIIEIPEKIKSKIKLVEDYVRVGDKLYTVGCPKGRTPHITFGHKSTDDYGIQSRASLDSYFGGSGGGIYISNLEVVGVMRGIGVHKRIAHTTASIVVGEGDKAKLHFILGQASYFDVIPSWTEYISAYHIMNSLEDKNLLFVVIADSEELDLTYVKWALITLLQVAGVLLCVFVLRKQIFS